MPEKDKGTSGSFGFQETILSLPSYTIILVSTFVLSGIFGCFWLAATSSSDSIREITKAIAFGLIPVAALMAAALAVRRTSTHQVDRLIELFLEKTIRSRLESACLAEQPRFPFGKVELISKANGGSYVTYQLYWKEKSGRPTLPPVSIEIKMNVINIEIIFNDPINIPEGIEEHVFYQRENSLEITKHPTLKKLSKTVQGSIEEGYKIRASITTKNNTTTLNTSFRQKLENHFLASPFLKRYHAEDIIILIGVYYLEILEEGLLISHD